MYGRAMQVRAARADDYDAFTRFWAQLGLRQPAPLRERWVELLCPHTIFLVEGDVLVAYNLSFAFGARGDVRQVVVDEAARRRGVGKQLMEAVATKLRAAGCTEWRLEVDTANGPARALYHAVGMRPHHAIERVEMDRSACERYAATRSGHHTISDVDVVDDAALEAHLDLGAGQVARWRRARPGSRLVRVGMTALTQIWRDFSPAHGLLFPFLAPDADVAAHLMAEALPGPYEVCVINHAAYSAMLAAGAREKEQQIEYAGTL
jgi:ribosomal protein S18 acetylase RimI-like enzyme